MIQQLASSREDRVTIGNFVKECAAVSIRVTSQYDSKRQVSLLNYRHEMPGIKTVDDPGEIRRQICYHRQVGVVMYF